MLGTASPQLLSNLIHPVTAMSIYIPLLQKLSCNVESADLLAASGCLETVLQNLLALQYNKKNQRHKFIRNISLLLQDFTTVFEYNMQNIFHKLCNYSNIFKSSVAFGIINFYARTIYRGADKSLARSTS